MKGLFVVATIGDAGPKLYRVRSRCRGTADWTCDIVMDEYGGVSRRPVVVYDATIRAARKIEADNAGHAYRIYTRSSPAVKP